MIFLKFIFRTPILEQNMYCLLQVFKIELYLQCNLVLGTQVHTVDHRLQWYGDMLCCLDNVHNCCYTCLHKIQPYILLKRILSWVIHTFVKNCQCIFSSIHVWNKCYNIHIYTLYIYTFNLFQNYVGVNANLAICKIE